MFHVPAGVVCTGRVTETPNMSNPEGTQPVPYYAAVVRMVEQLEAEHKRFLHLRVDLHNAEKTCNRLLTALSAAFDTLPKSERIGLSLRIAKLRRDPKLQDRPRLDKRQLTVLEYLAARPDETVTNAELRLHLTTAGIPNGPKYVSALLARWAADGLVKRLSHGCYRVNASDPRLTDYRLTQGGTGPQEVEATGSADTIDSPSPALPSPASPSPAVATPPPEPARRERSKLFDVRYRMNELRLENVHHGEEDWSASDRAEFDRLEKILAERMVQGP